jgi:hypothetical protein
MFKYEKYIGKNVKRKNLIGGFKHFIVISYSDLLGFKLFEPNTHTRINVSAELFNKQFKVC